MISCCSASGLSLIHILGSQLIAGGVNGVVNATKQAASKNIKKVKVTIKTNYAVFLMEKKEPGES